MGGLGRALTVKNRQGHGDRHHIHYHRRQALIRAVTREGEARERVAVLVRVHEEHERINIKATTKHGMDGRKGTNGDVTRHIVHTRPTKHTCMVVSKDPSRNQPKRAANAYARHAVCLYDTRLPNYRISTPPDVRVHEEHERINIKATSTKHGTDGHKGTNGDVIRHIVHT